MFFFLLLFRYLVRVRLYCEPVMTRRKDMVGLGERELVEINVWSKAKVPVLCGHGGRHFMSFGGASIEQLARYQGGA